MLRLLRSAGFKVAAIVALWLCVIATLRFKPWKSSARAGQSPRRELMVGFLPVT